MTKAILLVSLFCISSYTCGNKHKDEIIRSINISYNIPILNLDGELLNIKDSFSIYYIEDFILYKFPYKLTKENEKEILNTSIKYNYFAHKAGEIYGFLFDSLTAKVGYKILADSLLKIKAFTNFKFYDRINDSLNKAVIKPGIVYEEEYISKVKYDQSYADTTYFYYTDKLKKIEYSFSKELDSIRNLKLFKIKILFNSQYYKGYKFKFPERQFLFEMKEIPVETPRHIIALIEKTKNFY